MFLLLNNLCIEELIYKFYTLEYLTKYFKQRYLFKYKKGLSKYKICRITLEHKMHFQNHVLSIHG